MADIKYRVDKDDLQAFKSLFEQAAAHLEGDDALIDELEQTAEFIEGYYLPYPAPALIILPDLGALFAWIVEAQEFLPLTEGAKQAVDALIKLQQK